ncbi:MAG: phosphoethanolamine--lipid A transferase [Gammaproteobacteria bacterium]|nr:phosphoethanolamine--lipid A transferase [Gammaproteobacteria bacterium]
MIKAVRSQYVVLLFSLFLVLGYNQSLWQGVLQTHNEFSFHNALFLTSVVLFLTAIINFLLNLIAVKHLLKPALIILIISAAMASFFMDSYGVLIDSTMVQNVFETDAHEATELLNFTFVQHVVLWGLVPAFVIYKLDISHSTFFRQIVINLFSIIMSVLVIGLVAACFYQDYASTFRNHREFRYLINPTNYIYAIGKTLNGQVETENKPVLAISQKTTRGTLADKSHRSVTILVLGETARAQQFHINGYKRQTTPHIESENVINFSNVSSCGTTTAISVPCMFSKFSREEYDNDKGHNYQGLLDEIAASGMAVYWRENNSGCKGVCDRVEHENVVHIDVPELCNANDCFDEAILDHLDDVINKTDKDMLVVLHQKGSHGPAYYQRIPKSFEQFTPVCQSSELQECSQQEITNAYDNTILYTDFFLGRVISFLKNQPETTDTAMIYLSDHGESLGEKNMYLHGAPYFMAPKEQTHVPMLLWLSNQFSRDYHINTSCLKQHSDVAISHDNLFHSMLGMLDISSPENYRHDLDIFANCRS